MTINGWIDPKEEMPGDEQEVLFIVEGSTYLGYWDSAKEAWVHSHYNDFDTERVKWWTPIPANPINQDLQERFEVAWGNLLLDMDKTIKRVTAAALREIRIEIAPLQALVLYLDYFNQREDGLTALDFLKFIEGYGPGVCFMPVLAEEAAESIEQNNRYTEQREL